MRINADPATWKSETVELFVLEPRDVTERYVAWLNDPQINRYLESRFVGHTIATTLEFVNNCLASPASLLLGIRFSPLDGLHVGNIKLELNRHHGLGEVGILIGESQVHGKGVASSSIRIVAQIARQQLGLRKLTAGCYADNKASEHAFRKAGFMVEGQRPEHFVLDGKAQGLTLMGLLL